MCNKILNSKNLNELVENIDEFCRMSVIRDNDDECMKLKTELEFVSENDYLVILASYMSVAEDGDDVIEALYEFVANCKGFVEADEEMTQQVTKEEFEAVLSDCEEKCALMSCIEEEHTVNLAEVPYSNIHKEFNIKFKNNAINVFLSRISINENSAASIAEQIGGILYNVLTTRISPECIYSVMNKYIPETRKQDTSIKQLFKKYFYEVVLYKERKPGIYTKFDEHMKRVIVLEFYKKIIQVYLEEGKGNKKNGFKTNKSFI